MPTFFFKAGHSTQQDQLPNFNVTICFSYHSSRLQVDISTIKEQPESSQPPIQGTPPSLMKAIAWAWLQTIGNHGSFPFSVRYSGEERHGPGYSSHDLSDYLNRKMNLEAIMITSMYPYPSFLHISLC